MTGFLPMWLTQRALCRGRPFPLMLSPACPPFTFSHVFSLQKCLDNRYDRLYLADVDDLFVCNLDDGLTESSRMLRYRISQEQRRDFYQEAVRRQNDCI